MNLHGLSLKMTTIRLKQLTCWGRVSISTFFTKLGSTFGDCRSAQKFNIFFGASTPIRCQFDPSYNTVTLWTMLGVLGGCGETETDVHSIFECVCLMSCGGSVGVICCVQGMQTCSCVRTLQDGSR